MTFEVFAWLLLPLLPALIALYFLKLKRQQIVVSSTFLWKKSLEDLHVNSPFQRLRRSLLLLLQLLILVGLFLAASRPVITGRGLVDSSRILLIDVSASMNVKEAEGTRLDLARQQGLDFVESMRDNGRLSVITFSNRATLIQSLTNDKKQLRAAIEGIEPTSNPTDFLSALQVAAPIAEATTNSEIYVLSDGAVAHLTKIDPELERLNLKFISIGTAQPNVGITEINVNRDYSKEQRAEVFVSVLNDSKEQRQVTVSLFDDDRTVDAAVVEVAPGKTTSRIFDVSAFSGRTLAVEVDRGGALEDDDRAWVHVTPPRPVDLLLIGPENWIVETLVGVQPLFEARRIMFSTYQRMVDDGRIVDDLADVLVFNGRAPKVEPDRPAFFIGCYPDIPEITSTDDGPENGVDDTGGNPGTVRAPTIVDWDRVHPINSFVSYADVTISKSHVFRAAAGYHSVLDGAKGSLAGTLILTPSGRPAVNLFILGFSVNDTDWALRPSFPIFFSNVITWLGLSQADGLDRYRTGETLVTPLTSPSPQSIVFGGPGGRDHLIDLPSSGEVSFSDTSTTGIWRLSVDGNVVREFPVSLLSHDESRIEPLKEIGIGDLRVGEVEEIPTRKDLWKWFALGALAILLGEWWLYNRRMAI